MSTGFLSPWVPGELRWLWQQIRPFLGWHLASLLCLTAGSLLALLPPLVLKWMIDQVLPQRQLTVLPVVMALVFIGYLGRAALASLGSYLTLSAGQKVALALRLRLLSHLDTLSADYYDNAPLGAIVYPFKEPVEEIAYFGSDLFPALMRTLLMTCLTLTTMILLSPALTLAVVPLAPVFFVTRQHFRKRLVDTSDGMQQDRMSWSTFLEEHLASVLSIQLLGQEKRQQRNALRLLARALRSQQKLFITGVWFTICTALAIVTAMSAAIGYGGWSVVAGTLSLGSMVAFYGLVTQLFEPLSGAAELYAQAQKTFASVRRVQVLLAQRATITNCSNPIATADPTQATAAHIEIVAAEFGYPRQKNMLRIGSLRIPAGTGVAIVGENGAGKSTLAKLISRIYDLDSGSIRIGDKDVRHLRLEALRRQVCYLPRDPVLFDGTLASNLRFVRPAVTDHELQEVVRCCGLAELVATLPARLGERIGPGACQLSGGQRQRLAIARALLQRPQVLILDEATSCLDPASEKLVVNNLRRLLPAATLIMITHRLSTLGLFDRIVVLSGGQIVEDGSPDTVSFSQTVLHRASNPPPSIDEKRC